MKSLNIKTKRMKTSNFAVFLDGYKSSNMASIKNVLQYKIDDLIDLLEGVLNLINSNEKELKYVLERNINLLKQKNKGNIIDLLITFGGSLKLNLSLLKVVAKNLDGQIKEKVRKIIYIFGEIAKMTEDGKLINIAIYVVSNYIIS